MLSARHESGGNASIMGHEVSSGTNEFEHEPILRDSLKRMLINTHPVPVRRGVSRLSSFICCLWLVVLASACREANEPTQKLDPVTGPSTPASDPNQERPSPAAYVLDSKPFSPTLPHLFDQGRIVVIDPRSAPKMADPDPEVSYAFSAVDRYGRVYHFDTLAKWFMAPGRTLTESLPEAGWDAAWNRSKRRLELLVTAPHNGAETVQLWYWRDGYWCPEPIAGAPPARRDAARLFVGDDQQWVFAGGIIGPDPASEAWRLRPQGWERLTTPHPIQSRVEKAPSGPDDQPTTQTETAPARALDFAKTRWLLGGDLGTRVVLITRDGEIWLRRDGSWRRRWQVAPEQLEMAFHLPEVDQLVLVWAGGGMGRDRFQLVPLNVDDETTLTQPEALNWTADVKINWEDEGIWRGWGRITDLTLEQETGSTLFNPDLGGEGALAIQLRGEHGELTIPQSEIEVVDLPPRLSTLRPRAAAYVPRWGGVVVPSVAGLGVHTERRPFVPPGYDQATTQPTKAIHVIERTHRFWNFKGPEVEWRRPPYDLYPSIGYPSSTLTLEGRGRYLTWDYPEPGLLRYEYREDANQKLQWFRSPLLTLRELPQVEWSPDTRAYLCDPVIWGDPAEVIVVGWCGVMGERIDVENSAGGPGRDAYREVPARGFMARIAALRPEQWQVSDLPMPFIEGARLEAAPAQNCLYLVGGRMAVREEAEGQTIQTMAPNPFVWRWNGTQWRRIEPQGAEVVFGRATNLVYDPHGRRLLSLTPRALYGFAADQWQVLWSLKQNEPGQTDELGLYVHPFSRMVLGIWFKPGPLPKVWEDGKWIPVMMPGEQRGRVLERGAHTWVGGPLPDRPVNLLPAHEENSFISIDAPRLTEIRLDLARDRDADRLLAGHYLRFIPAGEVVPPPETVETPPPASGPSTDTLREASPTPTAPATTETLQTPPAEIRPSTDTVSPPVVSTEPTTGPLETPPVPVETAYGVEQESQPESSATTTTLEPPPASGSKQIEHKQRNAKKEVLR